MNKKLKTVLAGAIITANIFVFAISAKGTVPSGEGIAGKGVVNGLKGSIKGVFACHCPDDAANCYCAS